MVTQFFLMASFTIEGKLKKVYCQPGMSKTIVLRASIGLEVQLQGVRGGSYNSKSIEL